MLRDGYLNFWEPRNFIASRRAKLISITGVGHKFPLFTEGAPRPFIDKRKGCLEFRPWLECGRSLAMRIIILAHFKHGRAGSYISGSMASYLRNLHGSLSGSSPGYASGKGAASASLTRVVSQASRVDGGGRRRRR